MYQIEKRMSAFFLTFGGVIGKEEMEKWRYQAEEFRIRGERF